MKPHGQFTQEVKDYLNTEVLYEIVRLSRMGVAPETGIAAAMAPKPVIPPKPVIVAPAAPKASGFVFGAASEAEMKGVNKDLVACNYLALQLSTQDYCCYDGIRTYKEQQQHVANGTSQTMQSKHLQGLAVDNVPWINGGPVWDWDGCYKIALAMDQAATQLGIAHRITWGGAWDRKLSDFGGSPEAYKQAVEDYKVRHPGKDFIDGPHFEILP